MTYEYISHQKSTKDVFGLYSSLGWQGYLKLSVDEYDKAMKNSYYTVYVYDDNILIGTGRVISDGIMNGYLCGLGVLEEYRSQGIGNSIMDLLIKKCEDNNLHIQLFCEDKLVKYYESIGFKRFGSGMILE